MMKILFKLSDYAASILMGAGTLLLVSAIVGSGWNWNTLLAMLAGMVLGTVVLFIVMLAFSSFATLFEIIPVGMVITMLTGMVAGMLFAATELGFMSMLPPVVAFSILAQFRIDLYNIKLKGEVELGGR